MTELIELIEPIQLAQLSAYQQLDQADGLGDSDSEPKELTAPTELTELA